MSKKNTNRSLKPLYIALGIVAGVAFLSIATLITTTLIMGGGFGFLAIGLGFVGLIAIIAGSVLTSRIVKKHKLNKGKVGKLNKSNKKEKSLENKKEQIKTRENYLNRKKENIETKTENVVENKNANKEGINFLSNVYDNNEIKTDRIYFLRKDGTSINCKEGKMLTPSTESAFYENWYGLIRKNNDCYAAVYIDKDNCCHTFKINYTDENSVHKSLSDMSNYVFNIKKETKSNTQISTPENEKMEDVNLQEK